MHKSIPYLIAGIVMVILGGMATFLFLVQGFGYGDCLEIKGEWDSVSNKYVDNRGTCVEERKRNTFFTVLVIPAIPAFWLMSLFPKIEIGLLDSNIFFFGLSFFLKGFLFFWVGKMNIKKKKKGKRKKSTPFKK